MLTRPIEINDQDSLAGLLGRLWSGGCFVFRAASGFVLGASLGFVIALGTGGTASGLVLGTAGVSLWASGFAGAECCHAGETDGKKNGFHVCDLWFGIKNCLGEAIVGFYATPLAATRKFIV